MANQRTTVTDISEATTGSSFVFLQILSEEQKCTSNSLITDQETPPKYFSLDELQSFVPNVESNAILQHSTTENVINTRQKSCLKAHNKNCSNADLKNCITHVEILQNSKKSDTVVKAVASKSEGRKAPGSNRILPLITSVWEDADLHWKRQKSPKSGRIRKDNRGKNPNKKHLQGGVILDEASEEEEWLERQEKDDHGGSLFRAYSDFFMAEEGGEDREDCICAECGAEFLTAIQVAYHLEYYHNKEGIKLHQCFVCRRKRYPSLVQLNQHLSIAHGIPRPQLTCRTCFMELAGESEAKAHSRKHQALYTCSRCPLSQSQNGPRAPVPRFATCFLLAEHLREIHLPQERPHVCSVCGRHFIHQFVRDLHLQRRHCGYSLTCPEVHQHPSSFLQEILSFNPDVDLLKDSLNGTCLNSFAFLPIASSSERQTIEDSGESTKGTSSFTRNDNQLVSCESNQICLVSKQDKNVFVPENSSVAEKASSLSCSKGGFLFADEVSLLRHVFLAHGKLTNLRLLKWAKEADREDTLFEELWRVYLNISTKHHSIKIVKNKVGLIEPLSQKKGENSTLTIPERFSPDNYALSRINKETNQSKNIIETNAIIMKQNELFKLSQVINSSIIKNDDKAISLSNKIPSSIPTNDVTHSSNDLVEGIYLNSSSSSTQLIGKSNIESSLSSVENIFNMSSVDVAAQVNPGLKCQKVKLTTKVPIVGAQLNTEIPNSVISCLMDVLDSVCDVLNERSNLKDFGNMAGDTSLQRNITSVRCLLCRYLASNPLALERHRQRRHFRNKHCPFCSLACQSVDAVWKHVSETHLSSSNKSEADENVSSVGPEEFQQKMHSQKPMQSSSGLRCPVCKKVFPSRGKCNNHQENVHKIEVVSRPLSCKVCSKKFQFQKALERHSLLHCHDKLENASQTPYSCPHCKQTFLRPGFLKRHIASHFEDVSKGGKGKVVTMKGHFGHSCPSCSRRLPTHAKLKAHIRTSHPPSHLRQRFVCSECPVRCNTASGLRVHMRVHTGERPYPCSKCDMSFKRHTALRKHLLAVHSATSESSASEVGGAGSILKCPNCTSTFRDRSNLVRHFLQVHRGLRRFVCGLCGTKYGQNQDLRRHLKVSHDVDAPRIIGSDRRSVDQIYVVPPIMDDLPADHPLAIKIRMIVEEEEQKLDEDSLPHFAETPQQLHLHIHKESVNLESAVSDEGKESEHNNAESYEKGKPSEKDPDKRISGIVSSSSTNKYNELEINNEELVLAGNKERLEQDTSNNQLSSEVKNVVGKNVSASKNKLPQRNLILDALISSQISPDMYQFDNNILPIEGGSQLGQEFESNITVSKSIENITVEPAEMNIIMTKQPLDSSLNFSIMPDIFLKNTEAKPSEASASKLEKCAKDKVGNTTSPKVPGNFTCCHCGKEFVDAIRLERHSKVHSDLKPHTCNICGKSFIEKCNLKVHMRSHTGERPYKCEICGKNMRYLKELTDHRRMHLGERPYVCHICSRAFLRLRDLQRHLHIHMSEKKHHCPICNKAFSRLDHLRAVHMRIHEPWRSETSKKCKRPSTTSDPVSKVNGLQIAGEVENQEENLLSKEKESSLYQYFDCQKCKKKFSTRAKLDKHLILHSGQKLHKCSVCGRNFALASYLRAHQNTHRKQQSYIQCPKCPRRFASQETLSVHDEKFHRRIEKLKKFNLTEANEKTGKSKDAMEACDEERFFMSRPGDFDVNLNLEEEMNIQEVELFDPASLSESEKHNTFVYLHVISDDLQIANDSSFIV